MIEAIMECARLLSPQESGLLYQQVEILNDSESIMPPSPGGKLFLLTRNVKILLLKRDGIGAGFDIIKCDGSRTTIRGSDTHINKASELILRDGSPHSFSSTGADWITP